MRPSKYTEELAEDICASIAEGESLRAICRDDAMPSYRTIFNWIASNEEFRDRYNLASQIRIETVFDDIFEIADDGRNDWMERQGKDGLGAGWVENGEAVRRSAIRIDARKWALARMAPKKYGDKLDLNHSGAVSTSDELDLSGLSRDERAVMKELILKAKAAVEAKKRAEVADR